MADLDRRIADLLEPMRQETVAGLLRAVAGAIEAGAEVEPEPMRRDWSGRIKRQGALSLPARGDLRVSRDGRSLVQRIEAPPPASEAPFSMVADGGFTVVIAPFAWDRAEMVIEARQPRPDWQPLRLWFLEWVQPRHGDVAPELAGAVHRLDGPVGLPGAWRFELDFGSAPVEAISGLVEAAAETGAGRLRLGPLDDL